MKETKGRYQASGRGYGFIITDDGSDDLFVPPRAEGGAWHDDWVTARPDKAPAPENGRRAATVTAVIKRSNLTVTGEIHKQGREIFLVPDNSRLPPYIKISGNTPALQTGDKAALTITSFSGKRGGRPTGVIAEVFGPADNRDSIAAAILFNYGISEQFPPDVLSYAEKVPRTVAAEDLAGRLDLRDKCIITIDGASAKDLDDAVSLERDDYGRTVLGVHIADVSHYVPPGSALDVEAWNRGTSVYYADKVVPMLPPALSNGICSLQPGKDRRTISCIMIMDDEGSVLEHTITKSVIRSKERMTYEDCNVLLAQEDTPLRERYRAILPMLGDLKALTAVLKKKRMLRGSLDLETREVYIRCDEKGRPVGVEARVQGDSESLIEECMLIANETVARHLYDIQKPAIYRVHEKPSEDKAEALRSLLAPLGYDLPDADSFTLQKVLNKSAGTPEQTLVHMLVLRSLMKARYDNENLGHFGLAAEYYCHFTSPIRRYPDLIVHRALSELIEGKASKKLAAAVKKAALQSSERELAAASAEREIEKCYIAEFMQEHIGEIFEGIITGVTRFGLFVTLTNGVEGLIPESSLPDDEYIFDEGRMTLTGRFNRSVFSFGMKLKIVCESADPAAGQVNFRPLN